MFTVHVNNIEDMPSHTRRLENSTHAYGLNTVIVKKRRGIKKARL